LQAIGAIKSSDSDGNRLADFLTRDLLKQDSEALVAIKEQLIEAAEGEEAPLNVAAMAALLRAEQTEAAKEAAADDPQVVALLDAIKLLPKGQQQALRSFAVAKLNSDQTDLVRTAAMHALSKIAADPSGTFELLQPLLAEEKLRVEAARALLRVPAKGFDAAVSKAAAEKLLVMAENTPANKRTSDEFVDQMRLVDRFLSVLGAADAKAMRTRLRDVYVRVIKIGTVEEEMRYDVPYFAVEAGRPVQILLENHDLMPHNLVFTTPGSLKSVAMAGLTAGPTGTDGLPYVPESDAVLAATKMIAPDQSTRLTITAPKEPGEYPYVCTFPQHWYRMYGVMVVVEDLDAWNKNPVEPANPLGSNRSFVQAWTVDDFKADLQESLASRDAAAGEKVFNEASCVACHKIKNAGGAVGPELTDIFTKWKGNKQGILREILDPSHKIDPKYVTQTLLTIEGQTYSGIVVEEDDDTITLLTSPDAKEPTIVLQDDIEFIKRSPTSMMPKALLDQFSREEVLDLMGYLQSVAP
jgi:putative heme-binding domain-containing protein